MRVSLAAAALAACVIAAPAFAEAQAEERQQARAIYQTIVGFDTSTEGKQNPAMAAYLADLFRAGGFADEDVRVLALGDTAGLLVRYRGDGSGGAPIMLLGHMDVVPARRADWERDPFTLIEEGGYFFGRGALDNKAGVAQLASVLLTLRGEGFTPPRDLLLWFSGDEETTGATTMALLSEHRALIGDPEFALNSDAGSGALTAEGVPVRYGLQTAEKTYASFTFTARNPGGHSSAPRPDNAIYTLAEALTRLRAFQFPVMWNETTLQGFRMSAASAPAPLREAMTRFVANPNDRRAQQALSQNVGLSAMMRTTCVATMLEGGHAENALPQSASATVNCRIFPGVPVQQVMAELQSIAGEDVAVAQLGPSSASEASPLRDDVIAAVTRAVHAHAPGVPITPIMSAGATDGLYFRAAGIATYGAGAVFIREGDAFAHGLNERVEVERFYNGLTHWRVLIEALAAPG